MDRKPRFMSNFFRSKSNLACWFLSLCLLLFQLSDANAEAPPAGRSPKDEPVRSSAALIRAKSREVKSVGGKGGPSTRTPLHDEWPQEHKSVGLIFLEALHKS